MQIQHIPVNPLKVSTSEIARTTYVSEHALSNDPLVDIEALGITCQPFAEREIIVTRTTPPLTSSYVTQKVWYRKTAAEMLVKANELVSELGFKLYVKDAYRPLGVQKDFWDYFMLLAKEQTGSNDHKELVAFAEQFCSNPTRFDATDPTTWPLHITGGAVDLTLVNLETNEEALMEPKGSGYGDVSHTHYAEAMVAENPTDEWQLIAQNRRILFNAMIEAGFTNYPHEWWHYDFGTPMYGLMNNFEAPEFFYGYIANPEEAA